MNEIRLNKYIASSGVCSRRMADRLIDEKKVKVNNETVIEKGTVVDTEKDVVKVNDEVIKLEEEKKYILMNKPVGYVTTAKEQFNRPCVLDIITEKNRVYPVGRLDMDTSGLLILTNDGDITNKITHPKNHICKTYEVITKSSLSLEDMQKLENGVDIGGYITMPAKLQKIKENKYKITISEGKNRQVRKMFESVGNKVERLKRISIGKLTLDGIDVGKYKYISYEEMQKVFM